MTGEGGKNSIDRTSDPTGPYGSGTGDGTPRAVSVGLLKGGVGTSTVAVNLARQLAARDHRVLLVDLDPNGHASVGLGFGDQYHDADGSVGDVLFDDADPTAVVHDTGFGFDVLPSNHDLERVERELVAGDVDRPSALLNRAVVDPLLGDRYDYVVMDAPSYRLRLTDNALVAATDLVLPLVPGHEAEAGLDRTVERQIAPLRRHVDVDVLALVPNRLDGRVDQRTQERRLLERLNAHDSLRDRIPNFARITDWEAVDAGEMRPTPGIRERNSITEAYGERTPLLDYDPGCDQLECFDELARVVEAGEVVRGG